MQLPMPLLTLACLANTTPGQAIIKTINHYAVQMNLFFDKSGINPELPKN